MKRCAKSILQKEKDRNTWLLKRRMRIVSGNSLRNKRDTAGYPADLIYQPNFGKKRPEVVIFKGKEDSVGSILVS